jgi:membrane protein DedA with SNARE-associated domain
MNPLLMAAVGSIVRHVLTMAAGYLVSHGIWTGQEAEQYVAAGALAMIGVTWAIWQKSAARRKLLLALALPGSSIEGHIPR